MRGALLAILIIGLLGTGIELILLEHYEHAWQLAPLALIALALGVIVWYGLKRTSSAIITLQVLMVLFVAAGTLGLWLHYTTNSEFALELDPSLAGFALFRKAIYGATPALAPGAMIQLGLVGLVYTLRHPRTRSVADEGGGTPTVRRQEWEM
jgi:hypothetical protein